MPTLVCRYLKENITAAVQTINQQSNAEFIFRRATKHYVKVVEIRLGYEGNYVALGWQGHQIFKKRKILALFSIRFSVITFGEISPLWQKIKN